ncbi:MAG: sigma-70 family RNA polymerase sigma factor [Pseudomonadota bacterium]
MGAVALKDGDLETASDADLLQRSADGDQRAFGEIVSRHLHVPFASARRLLGDPAEAEDVAQESLVRLWQQKSALLERPLNLPAWLGRVAANLAIDRLRARKRLDYSDAVPEVPVAPAQQRSIEVVDAAGRVQAALDALPDRQRVAVTLFHFEEMSQRDVAALMQVSEDALESLLRRGRSGLKSALADEWSSLVASLARDTA